MKIAVTYLAQVTEIVETLDETTVNACAHRLAAARNGQLHSVTPIIEPEATADQPQDDKDPA